MHDHQSSRRSVAPAAGRNVNRQHGTFESACASVLGLSLVATAVTEGDRHLLRYVNSAFLDLADRPNDSGLGQPLAEQFPALAAREVLVLLERVQHTGRAASMAQLQFLEHGRRGALSITLTAWPYRRAGLPPMTLIQYQETAHHSGQHDAELAQEMRDVNERLLVSGLREHEMAEESARRLVVAEEAVERSASALQTNVKQTQSLARRLITAQEAERTRVARELHDDVNQQLAGLSIELSTLRRDLPEDLTAARDDVDRLQKRATILIDTIRDLSHKLHPGSLRSAGLVPALRHLCAESGQLEGGIGFSVEGELKALSDDVALTLYRVAQEALRNVARHAGACQTNVVLTRDAQRIHLEISDDGCGFVGSEAHLGLGLLSMEERVLAVNGELQIDSMPGLGTRISVNIPIA